LLHTREVNRDDCANDFANNRFAVLSNQRIDGKAGLLAARYRSLPATTRPASLVPASSQPRFSAPPIIDSRIPCSTPEPLATIDGCSIFINSQLFFEQPMWRMDSRKHSVKWFYKNKNNLIPLKYNRLYFHDKNGVRRFFRRR
jgi:hypothetical protein